MSTAPLTVPLVQLRLWERDRALHRMRDAWRVAFPQVREEAREHLIQGWVERGFSAQNVRDVLAQTLALPTETKATVASMIERRFTPEELALFLGSTPQEQQAWGQKWGRTSAKEWLSQAKERSYGLSMVVLVSSGMVLTLGAAAGFFMQSPDLLDTVKSMANARGIPEGVSDVVGNLLALSAENQGLSGLVGLSALMFKIAPDLAEEMVRDPIHLKVESIRQSLQDRIHGFTSTQEFQHPIQRTSWSASALIQELGAIPSPYLPLLTHLEPKSLALFLTSEEDTRESMLRQERPSQEQRLDTLRALNPGKRGEFVARVRQAWTVWEGKWGDQKGVTLNSSLKALREERQRQRGALQIGPAPPRFSIP